MKVRKAVFSGSWYPARREACEREIEGFMALDVNREGAAQGGKGGIVPHAGWYFSGAIACNVIRRLAAESPPDAVAVFGMHLSPGSDAVLMTEGAWDTPFGDLPVAEDLAAELNRQFSFRLETARDFTQDNTIELQLPFIRYFFGDTAILPVGLPAREEALTIARAVVAGAARLGASLKVIGSTDLTHYGFNYGFTPQGVGRKAVDWVRNENDRRMVDALLAMRPAGVIEEALGRHNACCAGAAAGAVEAVLALGARKAETVAYATSYDKSPGDSFVGYVGVIFT
jgi:AmmeMemoRadiSam system protein B